MSTASQLSLASSTSGSLVTQNVDKLWTRHVVQTNEQISLEIDPSEDAEEEPPVNPENVENQ